MDRMSLAGLLAILALLAGNTAAEEPSDTAVEVVRPEYVTLHRRRTLPASLEPFEAVRLYAKVTGYLADLRVDIGDRVRKDDTLAVIEVPELAAKRPVEQAQLAEAEAQLAKAQAEDELRRTIYTRSRALRERGSITQQELDQARAQHAVAAADARLAVARVASARARLARLDALLAYATIAAPFDGVVTERFLHPGALVQAGANAGVPIVTVERADPVRAVVTVPEADVPFVDRGDSAILTVRAFPDRPVPSSVTRLADALDPATRTMRVEVDVPNPDATLRPGMYGELQLDLDERPGVVTVPAAAVMTDKEQRVVYVVAGRTARKVTVVTGAADGGRMEIRSGLDGTEQVVVRGGATLTDGAPVRVAEPGASNAAAAR
jgi:RND family efflux transporter MFP subunit